MKKFYLIAAAAAAVLVAGCAKNEVIQTQGPGDAVSFGVYIPKTVTKAGTAGEMTTTTLQTTGFGVFASATTGVYAGAGTMNFMYNQLVSYSTSTWGYTPVKYWPNQIQSGNTDSQPATAFAADYVSFFAYAPYVADPSSDATYGITAFTANSATGDPKVTYKVSDDLTKSVDLLWGVYKNTSDVDANGEWTTVASTTNTLYAGKAYKDLQKPALNTPIHFYFYHALSQLRLTAQAAYNQVAAGGTAKDGVKITISKVQVTVPGMYTQADLNLNNTTKRTPLWVNESGSSDLVLTVEGENLNAAIKDGGAKLASSQPDGVVGGSATNVITGGKYFTIIPKSGSVNVTVKIWYYVTTDDNKLALGYSRVENVIEKSLTFASGFAGNTRNTINMILGIGEVKLEATVEDWTESEEKDINLPINNN